MLVLMDEPFGVPAAMTPERLQDELVEIWTRTGLTVLFATPAIDAIILADRVVLMLAGSTMSTASSCQDRAIRGPLLLPSSHARLRVVGRGRGWGAPPHIR
jgi:ABC-type nitrate/sulfonate/bicarbonate transport system ATPase subunit